MINGHRISIEKTLFSCMDLNLIDFVLPVLYFELLHVSGVVVLGF